MSIRTSQGENNLHGPYALGQVRDHGGEETTLFGRSLERAWRKMLLWFWSIKQQALAIDLDAPFRKPVWIQLKTEPWKKAMDESGKGLEGGAAAEPADSKWTIRALLSNFNHLVCR